MYLPLWVEVKKDIDLLTTRNYPYPLSTGWYLRYENKAYYMTDRDGIDFFELTFSVDVVFEALSTGELQDCSTQTYNSFKKALEDTRKAHRMYFGRPTDERKKLMKLEEKNLDNLLSQVQHSHPDDQLVKDALAMRMNQKEYMTVRTSSSKERAINFESKIDRVLFPPSTPPAPTIQTGLF